MKKAILLLVILISIGSAAQKQKADTILTTLYYINPVDSTPKYDIGYRIILNNLRFVPVDENTMKKKAVIDTFYFVPVLTAKLDKDKKPEFDSTGNEKMELRYNQIQNSFVLIDGGKNIVDVVNKFYRKANGVKPK